MNCRPLLNCLCGKWGGTLLVTLLTAGQLHHRYPILLKGTIYKDEGNFLSANCCMCLLDKS